MPGTSATPVTTYTTTNAGQKGYFTAQLTVTNAGSWFVQAQASGQIFQYGTPIQVTAGTPGNLSITVGGGTTKLPLSSSVLFGSSVFDSYGNTIPNANVSCSITASNGGVVPTPITQPSPTNGFGQTWWYEGPFNVSGTYTVTATCGSLNASITIIITSTAPVPASLTNVAFTVGSNQYSSGSPTITIKSGTAVTCTGKVLDQYGNPYQNGAVNVSFDGGSSGFTQVVSNSSGIFTSTVTPYTVGTQNLGLWLNVPGGSLPPLITQAFNVIPGDVSNVYVYLNPSSIGVDNSPAPWQGIYNVIVYASDVYNNPITSATATISTTTTDSNTQVGLPTTININNGIGQASNLNFRKSGSWPINVTVGTITQTAYLNVH
jgi:hypothetical protein